MLPNTLYYSSVFQSLFDKPTSTLKFPQTTQLPTQIKKLKKKSPPVFSLHLFPLQKSQTISPHPLVTHTLPTHKSLQRCFFFFFLLTEPHFFSCCRKIKAVQLGVRLALERGCLEQRGSGFVGSAAGVRISGLLGPLHSTQLFQFFPLASLY